MSAEQFKKYAVGVWSQKITSEEGVKATDAAVRAEYDRLWGARQGVEYTQLTELYDRACDAHSYRYNDMSPIVDTAWWVFREAWRFAWGVREPLPVNEFTGAKYMGVHLHPARDGRVGYYRTFEDGARDKVTYTTFAKWLAMVHPTIPPATVANLHAELLSHLDDSFHIAYDPEEVERVYTFTRDGAKACMSKSVEDLQSNQELYEDFDEDEIDEDDDDGGRYLERLQTLTVHPVRIYAAKQYGVGVAYLKDAEGRTTARSVIYDNPDDPADKRYVFVYGANMLKAKLERAGYKPGALRGVKLPLHRTSPDGHVIMPYVDNKGDTPSSTHAFCAVWFEGCDYVEMLDSDALRHAGLSPNRFDAQWTRAFTPQTEPVNRSLVFPVCALSGDALGDDSCCVLVNGECKKANATAAEAAGYTVEVRSDGKYVFVKESDVTPEAGYVWGYNGGQYHLRRNPPAESYKPLSHPAYADEQEKHSRAFAGRSLPVRYPASLVVQTPRGTALRADCMPVCKAGVQFIRKDDPIPEGLVQAYVDDPNAMVWVDEAEAVQTGDGALVHIHSPWVMSTFTGQRRAELGVPRYTATVQSSYGAVSRTMPHSERAYLTNEWGLVDWAQQFAANPNLEGTSTWGEKLSWAANRVVQVNEPATVNSLLQGAMQLGLHYTRFNIFTPESLRNVSQDDDAYFRELHEHARDYITRSPFTVQMLYRVMCEVAKTHTN